MKTLVVFSKILFSRLVFAVGLLLFALGVMPLLPLRHLPRVRREVRVLVRFLCRLYIGFLSFVGLITLQVNKSDQNLLTARSTVIVSNHPSLLDVVILFSLVPNAICIFKGALTRLWPIGLLVELLGFIPNQSDSVVEKAADGVRSGANLIIFPEGTRSPSRGLRPFERGAATVAVRSGAPILPIIFRFSEPILGKNASLFEAPRARVAIALTLCYPWRIDQTLIGGRSLYESPEIASRSLCRQVTKDLELFFSNALSSPSAPAMSC